MSPKQEKQNYRVWVGGHRGDGETDAPYIVANDYQRKAPENTLESIMTALQRGVDFIEIDVVRSKDDVPMVTHSNNLREHVQASDALEEVTHRPFVSQWTADELKDMRVGPRDSLEGYIPTLEEVMQLIADFNKNNGKSVQLNIELKDTMGTVDIRPEGSKTLVRAVKRIIDKNILPKEQILLSSFATSLLREAKNQMPKLRRGLLLTSLDDPGLGRALFPAEEYDTSRCHTLNAKVLGELHKELQLSAIHPEISTLVKKRDVKAGDRKEIAGEIKEVLHLLEKKMRNPEGKKLQVNCWFLEETRNQDIFSFLVFNAMDRAKAHNLPLGIIANNTRYVRDIVNNVYDYLPELDADEHRDPPSAYHDRHSKGGLAR